MITVRRGVKFHDGHELTSADVVYTFRSLLAPGFISPLKGAYRMVRSIDARDRYTVVFSLKEPFATFPANLVVPPIAPDGAGPSFRDHPIGTGPYKFVSYAVDDRLELAAFADYYGGRPRNDGLVFRFVPDEIMRGLELRKGTMDLVVNDIGPDIVHQLEAIADAADGAVAGHGLSIHRREPARSDSAGRARAAGAGLRGGPRRDRQVPSPRSGHARGRDHAAHRVGVRAGRVPVHARSRHAPSACSTRPATRTRTATVPRRASRCR